jgi:crotonobetainyl-CoA:carnitine CoA-transferase CaiB-like acyl-CoA transferase
MQRRIVLSVEQALTMTYASLRMVHLGWRVIRLEPTPVEGRKSRGDPNRYVGRPVAGDDRHSYFVAPNVGKEAIAVDLKQPEGQELVGRIIKQLNVDVFCTNTLPARHQTLGIDYQRLRALREDLIWCGISAMGLEHPQIVLALAERTETGTGKQIDVSMSQAIVSWLQTCLPMLDMGSPPEELKRSGNQHRQFIPVNAYRTGDGFIYMAIGSDAQWSRIIRKPWFASLAQERFSSNAGRRRDREELHALIEAITEKHTAQETAEVLREAGIPHSPITPIEEVPRLPFVASSNLTTNTPDGHSIRLPPPAVRTEHLDKLEGTLPFSPAYGEHTDKLLFEIGLSDSEIAGLRDRGVVA